MAKIVGLWQTDTIDDFLAYFPKHEKYTNEIVHKIIDLCEKADIAYDVVKGTGPRKEFAFRAKTYIKPIQSYLFARLDNKADNAFEFFKQMPQRNLTNLLNEPEIGLRR